MWDLAVKAQKARERVAEFFLRNACARHGVPLEGLGPQEDTEVLVKHEHTHKGLPPQTEALSPLVERVRAPVTTVAEFAKEKARKIWPKVLAAVAASSLLGGGLGYWLAPTSSATATPDPGAGAAGAGAAREPDQKFERRGSLFQFLEDNGRHLPSKPSP